MQPFLSEARAAGLTNLEGHRSVGGMRASLYNAMPLDGVAGARGDSCAISSAATAEECTMSYRILTLNEISARGLERLPRERYEVAAEIGQPACDPGALGRHARAGHRAGSVLRRRHAPGRASTTSRSQTLSRRGIPVFNAPGANANAVKELVLAGLLLAARNICQAWAFARSLAGR